MCGLDERRIDMIYCGWISLIILLAGVIFSITGVIESNDIDERSTALIAAILYLIISGTLYFGMLK